MRKTMVEFTIPDKRCGGCRLIKDSVSELWTWTCPFRKWTGTDTGTARPVKSCREATIKETP